MVREKAGSKENQAELSKVEYVEWEQEAEREWERSGAVECD
jgi:hypothetical protein